MNGQPKRLYEFDSFRVDAKKRQLLRDGQPLVLTSKVFDILLELVENCGQTIEKEALMQKVWADTFVEEGNLARNISTLRHILGDDRHEPRFIKTVPKRGYRFIGEVREILPDETFIVEKETEIHFSLKEDERWFIFSRLQFGLAAAILLLVGGAAFVLIWNQTRKNETPVRTSLKGTENAEAFELYQKGRAFWQTRSGENLYKATVALERAVQKDPNFALAHAALADAYAFDYVNWKKTEAEAREAMRLDPNLGEPHAAIGFVRMFWEWKLNEAKGEFKQAVQLSPNYATGHQWYAVYFAVNGRYDEAQAEMKQALELEPDSISINTDMCQTLYLAGKPDEAIAQCQKSLDINPAFLNAHLYLYEIYTAKEMWDEAVNAYFKIEELTNLKSFPSDSLKKLRKAYEKGGIRAFWRAQIEKLSYPLSNPNCYALAQTYARLGEKEKAVYWLKKAFIAHNFNLVYVMSDPVFYQLRDQPDFLELVKPFAPHEPES